MSYEKVMDLIWYKDPNEFEDKFLEFTKKQEKFVSDFWKDITDLDNTLDRCEYFMERVFQMATPTECQARLITRAKGKN